MANTAMNDAGVVAGDSVEINLDLVDANANCWKHQQDQSHHGNFSHHDQFVAEIVGNLNQHPKVNGVETYSCPKDVSDAAKAQVNVAKSVVRVIASGGVGTGFVIQSPIDGKRFIITNDHVFARNDSGYVQFDYDTVHSIGVRRNIIGELWRSTRTDTGFPTFQKLDFVVVEIASELGDDINYPPLLFEETQRVEALMNRPVILIGHPHGAPKKLSVGSCKLLDPNQVDGAQYYRHDIPSCPGSSGSPLLHLPCGRVSDGKYVVALHYWHGRAISFRSIMTMIRDEIVN